jgi:tRNA U34 2-thiouridine synthase MnmA/TrmU
MTKASTHKAVALLSGGLDSLLAILTMLGQEIQVNAIRFITPFDTDGSVRTFQKKDFRSFKHTLGFDITVHHLGNEMLEIVKTPKHGYGKNMNPCIDCRILMLREAKRVMDMIGADFLVTGEVLGQRPMSQRKDMLYHIDKEAGVTDVVVRPLSAQLLRIALPERQGIIDREKLYAFTGRSRKPQIALARELGLPTYPPPAGGCLLTEPNYAMRLKDLLTHDADPAMRDIDLLKTGRHFRYSPRCKIIVGRDKTENAVIESLAQEDDYLLRVEGYGSPMTLVTGDVTAESLQFASAICARYADAKNLPEVAVRVNQRGKSSILSVASASDEMIDATGIGKRKTQAIAKV